MLLLEPRDTSLRICPNCISATWQGGDRPDVELVFTREFLDVCGGMQTPAEDAVNGGARPDKGALDEREARKMLECSVMSSASCYFRLL